MIVLGEKQRFWFLLCLYVAILYALEIASHFTMRLSWVIPLFFVPALLEKKGARFLIEWMPFYVVILIYDALRGIADDLSGRAFFDALILSEKTIFFGIVPTVWLQEKLGPALLEWPGKLLAVFYFGHFLLPVAFLYYLWRKNHLAFRLLCLCLCTLSILGFITFCLFPAAPPWLAAKYGKLPMVRHLVVDHLYDILQNNVLPTFYVNSNPNLVAAFPSLHAGYPLLLWLTAERYRLRLRWFFMINFFVVNFAIVALGEHYVIDCIGGWLYALFVYVCVSSYVGTPVFPGQGNRIKII